MKKLHLCILVVGISIILLAGCGLSSHSRTYILDPLPYQQGINLRVTNSRGNIEIVSRNTDKINIVATVKAWAEESYQARTVTEVTEITTNYDENNNTLTVDYNTGNSNLNFNYRINVDYRIMLPEDFNAELITDSGDISIEKIKGNLYAQSSTGNLNIHTLEGNLLAYFNTDDIYINQLKAENNITVKTSTGKINIDYLELDSNTDDNLIETSTGNIRLNISGNTIIRASTITGDIIYEEANHGSSSEFIIGRSSSSWTPELILKSHTGDIELNRW